MVTLLHILLWPDKGQNKFSMGQNRCTWENCKSGPCCSKLRTLLDNISLKFQMLKPQICQYFLLKNLNSFCTCEKLLQASLIFSTKNISVFDYKVQKTFNELTSACIRIFAFHCLHSPGFTCKRGMLIRWCTGWSESFLLANALKCLRYTASVL